MITLTPQPLTKERFAPYGDVIETVSDRRAAMNASRFERFDDLCEVNMAGDVLILAGGSLTSQAGTRIQVVPAEGTKIDPEYLSAYTELLVRGRLDIQGTAEAPVRFVIDDGSSSEDIAWAGITLDHASDSRIRYAILDRADMAIRCVRSSPQVVGNRIRASRYGIIAQQNSHPEVRENHLQNGEGGIFCWRGSNPLLHENLLSGHDEEAIFVDADSRPVLARNRVSGNAIGLALYPRDLSLEDNAVAGNREDLRWLGRPGPEAE